MLACLQRPNQPVRLQRQQLTCAAPILDTPLRHTSEPNSAFSLRYPSAAELDAYAQRTADSPLSIKIFPANVRVPQHKQISRTVNGLDTRFVPCSLPYAGGYQGLLAIVKTKGVLKSSDGRRVKLSPIQMAVAPYAAPQRPYGLGSHAVVQQIIRPSNVHSSPSFTAASCAESGFTVAQNGLAYSGAVLPTQSADVAGLGSDYWPHQSLLRVYGSGAAVSRSPELCYRSHPVTSSPFSFGQFFAPAPDSDCYNPPELPAGSSMGTGHAHLHARPPPYPPGKSRCQASVLSSSLRSLESLISEIRPPCIKERMLGRGYAAGPLPLEHQPAHLQMPVFR